MSTSSISLQPGGSILNVYLLVRSLRSLGTSLLWPLSLSLLLSSSSSSRIASRPRLNGGIIIISFLKVQGEYCKYSAFASTFRSPAFPRVSTRAPLGNFCPFSQESNRIRTILLCVRSFVEHPTMNGGYDSL